jgi:nicotinate (nicotinamide) nucleotide adenylyltransferase
MAGVRSPPITPVPVPRGVKSVMVYGGTFDPPHFFHTVGPVAALRRLMPQRGWLLYVPAARNPLKARRVTADHHRLEMLKLGLDLPAPRSIWTDEIDRAAWLRERGVRRPSYTIETILRLKRALATMGTADVALRLLIGADQAVEFHRWKDARRLFSLARPAVMPREPYASLARIYSAMAESGFWSRAELARWCECLAPTAPMPAASTELRGALARAPADPETWDDDEALSGITTPVARYIVGHGLYGVGGASARAPRRAKRLGSVEREVAAVLSAAATEAAAESPYPAVAPTSPPVRAASSRPTRARSAARRKAVSSRRPHPKPRRAPRAR